MKTKSLGSLETALMEYEEEYEEQLPWACG